MKLVFTELSWEDYIWFQDNDRQRLKRINLLIRDALRSPESGLGKPERLKGNLSGQWSRRIDTEHRLVYAFTETELTIISCRFHYTR